MHEMQRKEGSRGVLKSKYWPDMETSASLISLRWETKTGKGDAHSCQRQTFD